MFAPGGDEQLQRAQVEQLEALQRQWRVFFLVTRPGRYGIRIVCFESPSCNCWRHCWCHDWRCCCCTAGSNAACAGVLPAAAGKPAGHGLPSCGVSASKCTACVSLRSGIATASAAAAPTAAPTAPATPPVLFPCSTTKLFVGGGLSICNLDPAVAPLLSADASHYCALCLEPPIPHSRHDVAASNTWPNYRICATAPRILAASSVFSATFRWNLGTFGSCHAAACIDASLAKQYGRAAS